MPDFWRSESSRSACGARKKAVDGLLWFVGYFDLLLFKNATYLLGNALYIRQHYKAIEVVLGGLKASLMKA